MKELDPSIIIAVISGVTGVLIAFMTFFPAIRKVKAESRKSLAESYAALTQRQEEEIERIEQAVRKCQEAHDKCEGDRRTTMEELHVLRLKMARLEQRVSRSGPFDGV